MADLLVWPDGIPLIVQKGLPGSGRDALAATAADDACHHHRRRSSEVQGPERPWGSPNCACPVRYLAERDDHRSDHDEQ